MSVKDRKHSRQEVLISCPAVDLWCASKWDVNNPRGSLRTLSIAPDVFSFDHFHAVNDVMTGRKSLLDAEKLYYHEPLTPQGRLLVYDPSMNLSDGMAESETDGLFDVNDCPPWDLWVGFIRDAGNEYLLSWIPDYLVELTQFAIEVTPANSLYWLDELDDPWAKTFI